MDAQQVLQHLQIRFEGRMVLYVRDIASILGKTEKAVESLIARDGLPFRLKTLGGRRCVDIFQVAEWLALEDEQDQPVEVKSPKSVRPAPSKSKPKTLQQPPPSQLSNVALSEVGKRILSMRLQSLSRWSTSTLRSPVAEDRMFLIDLFEDLSFRPVEVVESFFFSVSQYTIESTGGTVKRRSATVFDLHDARRMLKELWLAHLPSDVVMEDVMVQFDGKLVFRAARFDERWDLFLDDLELLPTS